jgi:predicted ester cyclase
LSSATTEERKVTEELNKQVVSRWFKEFWGNPWNPSVVDDLAAEDMLFNYPMHGPREGRDVIKKMMTEFRIAFPDLNFWGIGELIADADFIVGRWEGGGTHSGPAFDDLPVGRLPPASGRVMRFTGTSVFRLKDGKIQEEIGEEGSFNALLQLGLIKAA